MSASDDTHDSGIANVSLQTAHEARPAASARSKQKSRNTAQTSSNPYTVCVESWKRASEKAEERERNRTGPQPWVQRKLIIAVVFALFGWSTYVLMGIILRRSWYRRDDAIVGLTAGVILTTIYGLLWTMFAITYLKIIITGPGFARDHVPQSSPPVASDPPPPTSIAFPRKARVSSSSRKGPTSNHRPSLEGRVTHHSFSSTGHGNADRTVGIPYERTKSYSLQTANNSIHPSSTRGGHTADEETLRDQSIIQRRGSPERHEIAPWEANTKNMDANDSHGYQLESTSYVTDHPLSSSQGRSHSRMSSHTSPNPQTTVRTPPTTMPTPSQSYTISPRIKGPVGHPTVDITGRTERPDDRPVPYLDDLPPIDSRYDRHPSKKPVLDPYYRYCRRDGIIKPMRAHHCRICNTCVLGYDHHCPWIGGCVGAQNRKFFVVFLIWCSLYLFFVCGLLIASIVKDARRKNKDPDASFFATMDVNPQFIVLLVFAALFALFSSGMFFTHLVLLSRNASTVEWHSVQNMREDERAVLSTAFPACECLGMGDTPNGGLLGTQHNQFAGNASEDLGLPKGYRGRKQLRKRWDEEWGRIGKEGNLWWLGSKMVNWNAVMGENPWLWFLPVGDTSKAGLDYPTNPRFDAHGVWQRRRDWPVELQ